MVHTPGFLKLVSEAKTRIEEMTVEDYLDLAAAGHPHVLIDTREESEWAAGRAAGAVHLSKGVIERDIEAKIPDKGATLVLYCGGGYRSALAADALRQMGYQRPVSLTGGWRAIVAAGLPLEKPGPG